MTPVPAQPGAGPGSGELAALDALAEELNELGFPALRLIPPGKPPYVDAGQPGDMVAGERIYATAGTFHWHDAQPIAPTSQLTTAAAIIARALRAGDAPPS
jgi:hypothetical protein